MDDDALKGMKITRNTYQFNLRRRYEPVEHFRVKKSADSPLAQFLSGIGAGKRPFDGKGKGGAGGGGAASGGSPMRTIIMVAGVALLLFLVLAYLAIASASQSALPPQPPGPKAQFSSTFSQSVSQLYMLSYGTKDKPSYQAFASSDYIVADASNLNITARLYTSVPPRQVFVLRYPRSGADGYDSFYAKLSAYLSERGYAMSEISQSQIANMPPGAVLLVPTGYMPDFMLEPAPSSMPRFPPRADYTSFVVSLAAGGTNIIYIGDTFDFLLSKNGVPEESSKDRISASGITFDTKARPSSTDGLRMRVPLYGAKFSSRDVQGTQQNIWGSISDLKLGSGHLLMVPESLDGGWAGNMAEASEDIGRLITEAPFLEVAASANVTVPDAVAANRSNVELLLSPSMAQEGYMRITYLVNGTNGISRSFFEDYYVQKQQAGDLYFPLPEVVLTPRYLGGDKADLIVALREQSSSPVKLYFELLKGREAIETHELEKGFTTPKLVRTSSITTNVPPGRYILQVADNAGKMYAAKSVEVVGVEIEPPFSVPTSFATGEFNFSFSLKGQPASVEFVRAYVKDAKEQTMADFYNVSMISFKPAYTFKGNDRGIPHTFVLEFGGAFSREFVFTRLVRRNFWDDPIVQVLMVVALLVGAAGIYLRRPEKAMFSLDIPDFPPISVSKIPMKASTILQIFDNINRDYAWDRMPLKMEEIRSGFLKLTYNGKPVAVGDYNLERLLERLAELGQVETSLGYWGLVRWSAESGVPIARRAVFRRLRDLCVTNAIRFSKLDALPYCDVKLLIGRNEYFLHFFLGDYKVVSRALETIPLGRSWIVFADNYELEKFRNHLQSSESAALALKMEIYNMRAKLVTLDELPDLLRSMKVEG